MKLRWNWGTGVGVVYAVFAMATGAVVAFSMREHVDLVSNDYYDQSIRLDERRQAEARATLLGSAFTIAVEPDRREVIVQWPRGMQIESGTLTFYRPSDASADRHLSIGPGADGRQMVSIADLVPGKWMIQVEWRAGGLGYYAEREIIARETAKK